MKKNLKINLLSGLLVLTLSACATTGPEGNKQEAAGYNAQLGAGYLQKGRLDLSKEYLEKALAKDPSSIDANHYYALLQERLGDDAKASRHFNRAVRLSKIPSSELMNNHGSHLCRIGAYNKAVASFKLALKDPLYRTPEYAYTNMGVCLIKDGRANEAEQYFQQALETSPNFALALYQLAKLSYAQGDYAKAQAYWYRQREHQADSAESLNLCMQINTALQDDTQAEQCRAKLLAQFSNSAEAKQIY